jgi:membrane protease subunit (stomatin/prohibitin family)
MGKRMASLMKYTLLICVMPSTLYLRSYNQGLVLSMYQLMMYVVSQVQEGQNWGPRSKS